MHATAPSLSQVHLLGTLLALLPRLCQRRTPSLTEPNRCHFWLAGALWAALLAAPFYLVFVLAPDAMVPLNLTATNYTMPSPPPSQLASPARPRTKSHGRRAQRSRWLT